jgi:hypothetical protein
MRLIVLMMAAAVLAGCTYEAKPVTVSSAAAEIQPSRVSSERVSLYLDPALADLETEADTGYTCSAHAFPVKAGEAVISSFRKVVDEAFGEYEMRESAVYTGGDLDVRVGLETFGVDLAFDSGFWSAKATARAELVLKVDVSRNGAPVVGRTTIAGEGTGRRDGGCDVGAEASAEATEVAIKRTMENFIYKLVNSGMLDPDGQK